jgi:hypothetical protein
VRNLLHGAAGPEVEVRGRLVLHAAEEPAEVDHHPAAELRARQRAGVRVRISAIAQAEEGRDVGAVVAKQLARCLLHDGRVRLCLFYTGDFDAESRCRKMSRIKVCRGVEWGDLCENLSRWRTAAAGGR